MAGVRPTHPAALLPQMWTAITDLRRVEAARRGPVARAPGAGRASGARSLRRRDPPARRIGGPPRLPWLKARPRGSWDGGTTGPLPQRNFPTRNPEENYPL